MKKQNAHDLLAWAIVELGIQVPLETFYNMSPNDPLFLALTRAWRIKERRQDSRIALLCAVIANSAGSKKKLEIKDFMPKDPILDTQEQEERIKKNFLKYNEHIRSKQK